MTKEPKLQVNVCSYCLSFVFTFPSSLYYHLWFLQGARRIVSEWPDLDFEARHFTAKILGDEVDLQEPSSNESQSEPSSNESQSSTRDKSSEEDLESKSELWVTYTPFQFKVHRSFCRDMSIWGEDVEYARMLERPSSWRPDFTSSSHDFCSRGTRTKSYTVWPPVYLTSW